MIKEFQLTPTPNPLTILPGDWIKIKKSDITKHADGPRLALVSKEPDTYYMMEVLEEIHPVAARERRFLVSTQITPAMYLSFDFSIQPDVPQTKGMGWIGRDEYPVEYEHIQNVEKRLETSIEQAKAKAEGE